MKRNELEVGMKVGYRSSIHNRAWPARILSLTERLAVRRGAIYERRTQLITNAILINVELAAGSKLITLETAAPLISGAQLEEELADARRRDSDRAKEEAELVELMNRCLAFDVAITVQEVKQSRKLVELFLSRLEEESK